MKNRRLKTSTSILLMLILLTACATPASPTQPQPTETQAPPPATTESVTETLAAPEGSRVAGGLCTNAYYPTRSGATWTYKSTGGPGGEYSFTDTITAVRDDGFTLSTQIGDLTRTQEWTCTTEGLAALQLGGAPAAMLNSQNIQLNLDVNNATGVTFPVQINPSDQWQQNSNVTGKAIAFNEEAEAAGTVQMSFNAVGRESVTVPAGTFDALKVDVDVTLNIDANYEGITLPVSFTGDYTYWFAPNVGWVKASGTGTILGSSFSDTTELQSYSLP